MRVIGDLTRLNARRYPQKTALVMGDTRVSYAELEARANPLAPRLLSLPLSPPHRGGGRREGAPRLFHEREHLGPREQPPGPGVVDHVGQLVPAVPEVQGHQHGAALGHRRHDHGVFRAVERENRHPIAPPHPHPP